MSFFCVCVQKQPELGCFALRFNKVKSAEEEKLFSTKINVWKMRAHVVNYTNKGTPSSYPALNHSKLCEYILSSALRAEYRTLPLQTGTQGMKPTNSGEIIESKPEQ